MRSRPVKLMRLATAGVLLAWIPVLSRRLFDPDEFEHAHAAWCLWKGMLPYEDFFEHHTPWYYYVLRPLFNWFHVDASFDSARHFLVAGRGLSLMLTIAALALVWRIGRLWQDRRVAPLAGLLLVTQPVFFQKAVEIRPDILALPFFLGGLALLLRGLEPGAEPPRSALRWFMGAGLAVGAGVMCTQKMLFVLPGTLAGLAIWALAAGAGRRGRRDRTLSIAVFLLGVALPGVLTWAAFASHHAGRAFIVNNFLLNAAWKHFTTNQLLKLVRTSAPILVLAVVGIAASLARFGRAVPRRHGELLLICVAVGLFVEVPFMPAAHRQYYLMALPIVCLSAADGLLWILARLQERGRRWFIGCAMVGLALLPLRALHEAFADRNDGQLAELRTVFETTRPTDLVMDGWQGMGVFRPHAFFYYFLHEETRAMLPPAQLDAYLDALETGRIRPKLIILDENLTALGPRFVSFVTKTYTTRDAFLYYARD